MIQPLSTMLDVRTLLLCLAVANALLAILTLSFSSRSGNRQVAWLWGGARLLQAIALALIWLRGVIPESVSVPGGNALLCLGFGLEAMAVALYYGNRRWATALLAVALLTSLTSVVLWATGMSVSVRTFGVLANGLLAGTAITTLYLRDWKNENLYSRILGISNLTLCLLLIVRGGIELAYPSTDIFRANLPQVFAYLPLLLLAIINGFGFIMLLQSATEERLRKSERVLEHAQAIARMGSWTIDFQSGCMQLPFQAARLVGLPAGEYLVIEVLGRVHPEDQERIEQAWIDAIKGLAVYDTEHRVVIEGETRWIHTKAEFERNSNGYALRATGMSQDITETRLTQEILEAHRTRLEKLVADRTRELQDAESNTRLLLESTADGLLGIDMDFRITFVNPAACRILSYAYSDLIGADMHALLHHSRADGAVCELEQCGLRHALLAGHAYRSDHEVFWNSTNQPIPVSYATQPMRRAGALIGAVISFSDITEKRAAEVAIHNALAEAERLARVRSEFIANMSHEIRTPMNAVLGLAQIGLRENPEGRPARVFGRILDSGQHLLGIIDDILDFSKIEAGKLPLEEGRVELAALIDRAIELTAGRAYAKGLKFSVHEANDLPTSFTGDALRISQILVNLIGNAVKFTERGFVQLSVAADSRTIRFRVRDTGIGVSAEQQSHLFHAFEQADGTTTRRFGGTGLGLVISRKLAMLMGGDIILTSIEHEGSCFTLELPLKLAETALIPSLSLHVRLVHGDQEEAELLTLDLQRLGMRVSTTQNTDLFDVSADAYVIPSADLQNPEVAAAAESVALGGGKIIVTTLPGLPVQLAPGLDSHALTIEYPLRVRHLLSALAGEPPSLASSAPLGRRLAGLSVLAAEDNEVNRIVLSEMLIGEGAVLTCVENGALAVERVEAYGSKTFDVVVTDIQMPVMDGYEATRRIRELAPELPVIALTAHAMPGERERCLEAGMCAHLSKPVDLESLVSVILSHIATRAPATTLPAPAAPHRSDAEIAPIRDAIVDWRALENNFSKRPQVIVKLCQAMLDGNRDCAAQLRALAETADFEEIARLAHRLKGACGNLMAREAANLASRTDQAARMNDAAASALCRELADAMEALFMELARRIQSTAG